MGTLLLAGLAGILASLSPCVLPLLPMVLAAALAEHRLGPLALAAGLAASFAAVGIGLSLVGFAAGIEPDWLRVLGAALMLLAGAALLIVPLADRFAMAAERVVAPVASFAQRMSAKGLAGQAALGAVLGLAWAPCTGPALGSAIALAAQAEGAARAGLVMAVFALGAAVPLLALGYLARGAMPAMKRRFGGAGTWLRPVLGGALAGFGLLVLTGTDKRFETWATAALPQSWVEMVTRF